MISHSSWATILVVVHNAQPEPPPSGRSLPDGAPAVSWPIRTAADLFAAWHERDRRYTLRRGGGLNPAAHMVVADWRRSEIDHLPVSERTRALEAVTL